jgi:hypothetical protein
LHRGANIGFFHNIANGRRKCYIESLETGEGGISKPSGLREHIDGYYKKLFGREERGGLRLEENFWGGEGELPGLEAENLVKTFSEQEIKAALDNMKTNSAPGPDGLPVKFYKCFWN